MQPAEPPSGPVATPQAAVERLPGGLRLGPVHLTVTDLDRSIAFYQDAIGLRLGHRDDRVATMGAGGEDLIVFVEEPAARRDGRHAGLYHFALLHPSRDELARAALRLASTGTPIEGASDHRISEAIYLPDPDGNGIELAADRPREEWPDLATMFAPQPLDLGALIDGLAGEAPTRHADAGLVVGHLHLHVSDVDAAIAFYRDAVGFDVMTLMPTAAFMAAGGYHHHVAVNTWRGVGVPRQPPGTVGLRHWTVVLPHETDLVALRERLQAAGTAHEVSDGAVIVDDPFGITAHVVAAAAVS